MAKFKKGSPQAKAFMAKLRAARGKKSKPKKNGSTLYVEKNETKKTKPKRVIKVKRTKTGTFKSFKALSGTYFNKGLDSLNLHYGQLMTKHLNASTAKLKREIAKEIGQVKKKIITLKRLK